jgi:hypothetical protein
MFTTRLLSLLAVSFVCASGVAVAAATPTVIPLAFSSAAVPRGVSVKGNIVNGLHWTDRDGEHWLVLTEVPAHADTEAMSAELYAYDFVTDGATFQQVWMTQDFVKNCDLDMTCAYVPGSMLLSDMDSDGQAETMFIYRTACRGDPSPPTQKLLMHEGAVKYALRGTARVVMAGVPADGGTYTADPGFSGAPASFVAGAASVWKAYMTEGQ